MARARAREVDAQVMPRADTLELDAAFRKYEDDFYSKMLDPGGNIDLESDFIPSKAKVKEATLTTDLSSFGADLDNVFAKYPMIKPFFLFTDDINQIGNDCETYTVA